MPLQNNPPNEVPQESDKTTQQCVDTVNALVEAGNPKSNWFALCVICNSEGNTRIAIKCVETLTALDVADLTQPMIDELWAHAKSN